MATLEQKYKVVPPRIRAWFNSDEMDQIILEIDRKFELPEDEEVIPSLLFDVEIGDLPLEDLEIELAEDLELTPDIAQALYEEILLRVFAPLARDFVAFGIGADELAGVVAAQQQAAATPLTQPVATPVAPLAPAAVPVVPMAAPVAVATPMPMSVPAPAVEAPPPMPVSLYRDTLASQTVTATPRLGVRDTGDISGSVASSPVAQRAAYIDLGTPKVPSAAKDAEFRSIFVERATPLPQKIDYGTAPQMPQDMAPAPVPLSSAPTPMIDASAPFIAPSIEVVSAPVAPQGPVEEPKGFFESFMHRVAPWHARKFAHAESAGPVLPAATINYNDAPPAPPVSAPAPQQAGLTPVPLADVPAPPTPQA